MTPTRRGLLDWCADWIFLPLLVAALVICNLVTFVPEASWKRDLLEGALLLAFVGAALLRARKGSPARSVAGATTMGLGLTAAMCIWLL